MFVVDYIAAPQDIHKEIFALLVVALSIETGVYLFSFFTSKRYEVIAVYVYIIKVNHYTLFLFLESQSSFFTKGRTRDFLSCLIRFDLVQDNSRHCLKIEENHGTFC